jgi:hypothetical protein
VSAAKEDNGDKYEKARSGAEGIAARRVVAPYDVRTALVKAGRGGDNDAPPLRLLPQAPAVVAGG